MQLAQPTLESSSNQTKRDWPAASHMRRNVKLSPYVCNICNGCNVSGITVW